MEKRIAEIILEKCDYKESLGIEKLYDSDIIDILEQCHEEGYTITRKELEHFLFTE